MQSSQLQTLEFLTTLDHLLPVNKTFSTKFQLRRRSKEQSSGECEVKIVIVAATDNSEYQSVEIWNDSDPFPKSPTNSLQIMLKENLPTQINLKFSSSSVGTSSPNLELRIIPIKNNGHHIDPISSKPFIVVDLYLLAKIQNLRDGIFFKDIGGKDQGIEIDVSLRRSIFEDVESDPVVKDRTVDFRPCLRYERGDGEPDQRILQSFDDVRSFTTSNSGLATVKFRINEVSSKHRNEKFVIWLEPHYSAADANRVRDIAPGRSYPIEVRSKVNHQTAKRREAMAMQLNLSSSYQPGIASNNNSNNNNTQITFNRGIKRPYDETGATYLPMPPMTPSNVALSSQSATFDHSNTSNGTTQAVHGGLNEAFPLSSPTTSQSTFSFPTDAAWIADIESVYNALRLFRLDVEKLMKYKDDNRLDDQTWMNQVKWQMSIVDRHLQRYNPELNKMEDVYNLCFQAKSRESSASSLSTSSPSSTSASTLRAPASTQPQPMGFRPQNYFPPASSTRMGVAPLPTTAATGIETAAGLNPAPLIGGLFRRPLVGSTNLNNTNDAPRFTSHLHINDIYNLSQQQRKLGMDHNNTIGSSNNNHYPSTHSSKVDNVFPPAVSPVVPPVVVATAAGPSSTMTIGPSTSAGAASAMNHNTQSLMLHNSVVEPDARSIAQYRGYTAPAVKSYPTMSISEDRGQSSGLGMLANAAISQNDME